MSVKSAACDGMSGAGPGQCCYLSGLTGLTYPYISHLRNVDDNLSQPFFYELSHDPWIP
jgi:hypothetical protein